MKETTLRKDSLRKVNAVGGEIHVLFLDSHLNYEVWYLGSLGRKSGRGVGASSILLSICGGVDGFG